jgi:5'-nucleotidase
LGLVVYSSTKEEEEDIMKRFGPLSVLLCGVVAIASCSSSDEPTNTGSAKQAIDIQLLTLSDWHGQMDAISAKDADGNDKKYGGIGLLSTYFQRDRANVKNTLTLTSGDVVGATPAISSEFEDKPAIEGMNFLKLDYDTFGNHDFDGKIPRLKSQIEMAKYTYISSNMENVNNELGSTVQNPYVIKEIEGHKIALLGITNNDAPSLAFAGSFGSITISEPVGTTNKLAKEAREKGAEVVIVLAHMGATGKDGSGNPTGPLLDYAKSVKGVDVILGDHTDTVVNTKINDVVVLENQSKGRTYGRILVSLTADGKVSAIKPEVVDPVETADLQPDPAAATLIAPYSEELSKRFDAKIGTISEKFERGGMPAVERVKEVPIGDLIADAMRDYYKTQIAVTNGGGIRAPLPSSHEPKDLTLRRDKEGYAAGPPYDIVIGDIYTVLPFGNTCVVREITGKALWEALEYSVFKFPDAEGRFLQVSGFKFVFKESSAPGARVVSVTMDDGTPIPKDETVYTLVTNDFVNSGGDGYVAFTETTPTLGRDVMANVVIEYVKKIKDLTPPATLDRIVQEP